MANNKRINHNREIFNQVKAIDAEYMTKIENALIDLLSDKSLTPMDIMGISSHIFIGGLQMQCLNMSSYCDIKYGERYSTHIDYVNIAEMKKHQTIQDIYKEGIEKINEVSMLFQEPKKFLRLENIETQEEYNNLAKRYCNKFIVERINKDEYLELINKLKERGTELNLITNNF